ncbi:MAG: pyridoxine 5'-phosphate synthase [Candidatus Fischerbacteria bacterium RBG_13_37_8]|uniref:Pyridoxine 5'-phosphate synthase n=1 Tax=Candidatus Fischerbacteria bacterium RBG_13_37_8 TaxID=1817863 RepID=A0A1F5VIB7_9BACT|nr:MAG: pyridoxine 5'-phosphate synthase [Candidatus Fischerbacteria bacterium RBG_13_37_8]
MMKLGVNIDHIATIREARKTNEPDPVAAAIISELAGADGITVHLRGDRRHIQERDLRILKEVVKTHLNLEMSATQEMVRIATNIQPHTCTLVPEKPEEVTTEGGLDVSLNLEAIRRVVKRLQEYSIEVSIFIDPELDQIKASYNASANAIELNTNKYSLARKQEEIETEIQKIKDCAAMGKKLGMRILAGHALNYINIEKIVAILDIEELNIGHSIIARAALVGLERAVREMKQLIT